MIPIELLKRKLIENNFDRYGLCIFSPVLLAGLVNRKLNIAYGDSGDNLSVPLGGEAGCQVVRYLGGNYSSAKVDHVLATIDVVANTPGSILLVTHPGVGRNHQPVIAVVEYGNARAQENRTESFSSFAKSHLGIEVLTHPSNVLDVSSDGVISIATILSAPASKSKMFLAVPWEAIFTRILEDENSLFEFAKNPRQFEEFLAESYSRAGYNVELTPSSGDGGVDIIAELPGHGAIKILDQAKAYSENRVVTANDVRAVVGTLATHQDASKAIITTTSRFAPGVYKEFSNFTPTRLELRCGQGLISWLKSIEGNK